MLSLKNSLAVLRKTNALLDGHFVLSSGLHSPSYVQCAKLLSFPHKAEKFTKSLASKIKRKYKNIDLILAPAMGGVIIGYEIGRLLKKETIFCERINGKFTLRRGFNIKKGAKVLIIEDVITTGKSSLECVKLIKSANAKLLGFASIIDEKPKSFAFAFLINLTHSKLDFPVVITSSIIKTLDPFLILNPLLNLNLPLTRSQKIVSFFKSLPIS